MSRGCSRLVGVTGLRERNKAMRVEAILDATVSLLDTHRLDDVTTEQIAALANVSPATVYNLVGPRYELLRALVRRVVDDLVETVARAIASNDDPVDVAFLIVDHSVGAFTRHSRAYRQVVAAGRSASADAARSSDASQDWIDASELQVAALRHAQEIGVVRPDVAPAGLGRQVYISWIGAMEHWSEGRLDDEGFATATRHGLLTVLAASATEQHRDRFVDGLREVGPELDRAWRS